VRVCVCCVWCDSYYCIDAMSKNVYEVCVCVICGVALMQCSGLTVYGTDNRRYHYM
jgi:hypothetical protein